MQLFEISRSGMDVEWQRMEVIAQNLANAGTTRTALGGPYRQLELLSGPRIDASFESKLTAGNLSAAQTQLSGVEVYGIEPSSAPPHLVYEPGNPQADSKGMVPYPAIDHAGQMALMVKTSRVYEANVAMLSAAHAMYLQAMNIGSRS